jgi:alanine dehydrogenase
MSDIAGRLSVQIGAHLLHQPQGGKGLLLGGLPAAQRGHVVIIGGGVAGHNAAAMAAAMGAEVTVFELNRDRLGELRQLGNNVTALYPYRDAIAAAVAKADLLVGAVLIPGAKAPHIVDSDMVRTMEKGSVVIDISVDQGGCIETTHPTNYQEPTYSWEGVTHFGVTNMPGAVPKSASQALSAVLIPYVKQLAAEQWSSSSALQKGLNVQKGKIVHPAVEAALGR